MAKQEKRQSLPTKTVAVTYFGRKAGKAWEVCRVDVGVDGSLRSTRVLEHPDRNVAAERLRVLLMSREVML